MTKEERKESEASYRGRDPRRYRKEGKKASIYQDENTLSFTFQTNEEARDWRDRFTAVIEQYGYKSTLKRPIDGKDVYISQFGNYIYISFQTRKEVGDWRGCFSKMLVERGYV